MPTSSHLAATAAQDVIFLVLLVSWMGVWENHDGDYQFLEFFAGVAHIAALAKAVGYKALAYERDFGTSSKMRGKRSPMDLNSNAGLVFLDSIIYTNRAQAIPRSNTIFSI